MYRAFHNARLLTPFPSITCSLQWKPIYTTPLGRELFYVSSWQAGPYPLVKQILNFMERKSYTSLTSRSITSWKAVQP